MSAGENNAQPVGVAVPDLQPVAVPAGAPLSGRYATLEALDAGRHAADLYGAFAGHERLWTYLPYGPFLSAEAYADWITTITSDPQFCFYALCDRATGRAAGVASFLRIDPAQGSIEVGHINFSPALQRTRAATEAIFLMMKWAFAQGYRRFEWKCDALNAPSRRAAQRLGFSYEGVFRQAAVVKGRNRDTAWFAVTDQDWSALEIAFQCWLAPENFDATGCQRQPLGQLTGPARVASDPGL